MSKAEMDFPETEEKQAGEELARTIIVDDGEKKAVSARNTRRLLPFTLALSTTVLWLAGAAYYLYSAGALSDFTADPAALIGLIGGLTTPVAIFWLVALAFQRTDPLLERRLAMAQSLHKAIAPVEVAEQRLAQLNKSLTKELQNIEAVADLASDRIDNLEKRFQEQISNLFSATADTEARTSSIRDLLERERGSMSDLTKDIEGRFNSLETIVSTIAARLEGAGEHAANTADNAKSRVDSSLDALAGATEAMEARLGKASKHVGLKATEVQDMVVDVELRLQSVTDNVLSGMDRFRHDVEGLEGRSAELSEHMKTQATVLAELAQLAAQESAKIEETLRSHVGEVRTAATDALERTDEVSSLIADRTKTMSAQVFETVDRAKSLLDEAGQSLEEHCAAALSTSEQVNKRTLETTEATGKAVLEHAEHVDKVLGDGLTRARDALEETMAAISGHSDEAVAKAEQAAERTLQHIRQLRAGVEGQIEELTRAGETGAASLGESADRLASKASELTGSMKEEADALNEKASAANEELASVREQMSHQSGVLAGVLNDTRMKLARLEEDLTAQRDALNDASNEAAERVIEAAERFREHSRELQNTASFAQEDLSGKSGELVSLMENMRTSSKSAADDLTGAADVLGERTKAMRNELKESREALGSAADAFAGERERIGTETESIIRKLNAASDSMSKEVENFALGSMEAATRLDAASQSLMDQTERVQGDMKRAVEGTREELAASMDEISSRAEERITFLREEMQATLARVLTEYQETADQAEKESALLAMRIGTEAEKVAQRAAQFIDKTAEIEKRIAAATKNDFARTSALLMESLQSTSIDIHKALTYDLPDDVWEAYLSGDRSVFMRRTVKIADRKTRKTIADKFQTDGEFREAVTRYCRDFEGMMERAMMGDRGSAMSVTLVSSDMGKLYILLGQALKKFG
jgi:chromosome segregation ATPase